MKSSFKRVLKRSGLPLVFISDVEIASVVLNLRDVEQTPISGEALKLIAICLVAGHRMLEGKPETHYQAGHFTCR